MKRRCTYTKEMRAEAKAKKVGLVTVQVEHLDGTVKEVQLLAGPLQCRFADWAQAWLGSGIIHSLPNLEQHYLDAMEDKP